MPSRFALVPFVLLAACAGDEGFDSDVDPDRIAEGPALFSEHCAICHGDDGGGSDFGPDLTERVPGLVPLDVYNTVTLGEGRMRPVTAVDDEEASALAFYVVDTFGG